MLLWLTTLLLSTARVQKKLTRYATNYLSKEFGTKVIVGSVYYRFFNNLNLKDIYIEDIQNDTLLFIKNVELKIRLAPLLNNRILVKSALIENPKINAYRRANDIDFNYEFILNYFTTNDTIKKSKPKITIDLNRLSVVNADIAYLDELKRQQFNVTFSNLNLSDFSFNSTKNHLQIDALVLDNAKINISNLVKFNYNTDSLNKIIIAAFNNKIIKSIKKDSAKKFTASINRILIDNALFSYDNYNNNFNCKGVDYSHVLASGVKVFAEKIKFDGDTVKGRIQHIQALEQSGFKLNRLVADFLMDANNMEFKNLIIETPKSFITHYFAMNYNSYYDFYDFINKIKLKGDFKDATVAVSDVDYFAKALHFMEHNTMKLSGKASGTISNLKLRNLIIDAGNVTRFNGNVDLTGLPNINETFISAELDKVRTDAADIEKIFPDIKLPIELSKLGLTRISGHFDGFINDFVAKAEIVSQIGIVKSDVNLKFKTDITHAVYSGNLSSIDFDLGKLLNNDLLGKTSLNATLKGSGTNIKTVEANILGHIAGVELNKYNYKDVVVNGSFTNKTFIGKAVSNDENLMFDFSGEIDLHDSIPLFNFKSSIQHANLKNIHLLEENISLQAELNLNFSGNKIDNLIGLLEIKNTLVNKNEKDYFINNMILESIVFEDEGTKKITFESDVLNAEARGKISFENIGTTLQYFFNNYFKNAEIINATNKKTDYSQDFSFYVNINNTTNNLTELFINDLKDVGQTNIEGSFNSSKNLLQLNGKILFVNYSNLMFNNIGLNANASSENIFSNNSIENVLYKDSLLFEKINLTAKLKRDTIKYALTIQDSLAPNRLALRGIVQTDLKSLNAQFINSDIYVNNKAWLIDNKNSVFYDGKYLDIKNLDISKEKEKLSINTTADKDSSVNLIIALNDILLNDVFYSIAPLRKMNIKGKANGIATIINVLEKPVPTAFLKIDSLQFDNNILGTLTASSTYNVNNQKLTVNANLKGNTSDAIVKGIYSFSEEEKDNNLDFNININELELGFADAFLQGIISKTEGKANGNLTLNGSSSKPILNGKINVREIKSTIDYLNLDLKLKEGKVVFSENTIDLGTLSLNDNYNNTAIANGKINHEYFSKFYFDIGINTTQFEFMNSNAASNGQFYGKAYGSAKILIKGPLNRLVFDIEATTKKNTKVSISITDSKDLNQYSFYKFVDKDQPELNIKKQYTKKTSGVDFNINLTATQDAEVDLILSGNQGDVITARGDGNLKISFDRFGDLSIIGNYTIASGEYLFTLQNVISKKFEIAKGSQIIWAGSPYDARLAIAAKYILRASPYDLIEDMVKSQNDKLQQARIRIPVNLLLNIGGSISSPEVSFDIKIPDADPAIKSAVNSKLDFIRLEQNDLNKQVIGLLVLNKFLPVYNVGGASTSQNTDLANSAGNTVSEFVSNQLSIYLSDWLSKFVTDVQLDLNYRSYQSTIAGGAALPVDEIENRRELQLALSKSFFNDRVFIDVGGNFDFSGGTSTSGGASGNPRGNNVAGDFEIQYALTPDGRYKVKAFRRGEYDIFAERNRNRTGVGIQYKKEFDNWKDLMKKGRNRKQKKEIKNATK